LRFYSKQNIPTSFFPLIGPIVHNVQAVKKYGDFYYPEKQWIKKNPSLQAYAMNFADKVLLTLVDTKLIKEFYSKQDHCYVKAHSVIECIFDLTPTGLLTSEGVEWKRQKAIIANVFNYNHLIQNIPLVSQITDEAMSKLAAGSLSNVTIMDTLQQITGDVVGKMFFSEDIQQYTLNGKSLVAEMAQLIKEMLEIQMSLLSVWFGVRKSSIISGHTKRWWKRLAQFRQFSYDLVMERKRKFQPNGDTNKKQDMLDWMLKKNYETNGEAFSDWNIVDQFILFVTAGMETTATVATMAIYYLATNPDIKQILENEVKNSYKTSSDVNVSAHSLNDMMYLDAFIKEVLRVNGSSSAGIIWREASVDHTIGTFNVKKGTLLNLAFYMNSNNPKIFENPEKFTPERWLNQDLKSVDSFAYLPFSGGSRSCIGQHLAMIEMKVILCEFIRRFDFSLAGGYKLKMTVSTIYSPLDPIKVDLKLKKGVN
jgi:cytochrome P450